MGTHPGPGPEHDLVVRQLKYLAGRSREEPTALARDLLAAGRTLDAGQALELALEREEELSVDGLIAFGSACLSGGDPMTAQTWLMVAAKSAPDRPEVWTALAEVMTRRGDLMRAARLIERAELLSAPLPVAVPVADPVSVPLPVAVTVADSVPAPVPAPVPESVSVSVSESLAMIESSAVVELPAEPDLLFCVPEAVAEDYAWDLVFPVETDAVPWPPAQLPAVLFESVPTPAPAPPAPTGPSAILGLRDLLALTSSPFAIGTAVRPRPAFLPALAFLPEVELELERLPVIELEALLEIEPEPEPEPEIELDVELELAAPDPVEIPIGLADRVARFCATPYGADHPSLLIEELLAAGCARDAVDVGMLALERDPRDADLLLLYATALEADDNPAAARIALERAARSRRCWAEPWLRYAELALRDDDLAGARRAVRAATRVDPDHPALTDLLDVVDALAADTDDELWEDEADELDPMEDAAAALRTVPPPGAAVLDFEVDALLSDLASTRIHTLAGLAAPSSEIAAPRGPTRVSVRSMRTTAAGIGAAA